jgi:hypothetical protein
MSGFIVKSPWRLGGGRVAIRHDPLPGLALGRRAMAVKRLA